MGEKKVTKMLLKVDLQCCKCYKKVKKVLCKFPHVRDQVFDENANTVTIKVVCCNPKKIRDKIRCKGGASIKSIEIIPDKPPAPPKPKPPEPKPPIQSKPPEPKPPEPKPPVQEKPPEQVSVLPRPAPCYPWTCCMEYDEGRGGGRCNQMSPGYSRTCCMECYQGRGGGPCNQMCYGQPVRYYDGYCGRPVYDSWGGGGSYRPCYAAQSYGECFFDENPLACSIM